MGGGELAPLQAVAAFAVFYSPETKRRLPTTVAVERNWACLRTGLGC